MARIDITPGASTASAPAEAKNPFLNWVIAACLIFLAAPLWTPKLGNAVRAANERSTQKKLASLRAAVRTYKLSHEFAPPPDLYLLMEPRGGYLKGMVNAYTAEHGNISVVEILPPGSPGGDNGAWGYISAGDEGERIWVQCTHADTKGRVWSTY